MTPWEEQANILPLVDSLFSIFLFPPILRPVCPFNASEPVDHTHVQLTNASIVDTCKVRSFIMDGPKMFTYPEDDSDAGPGNIGSGKSRDVAGIRLALHRMIVWADCD